MSAIDLNLLFSRRGTKSCSVSCILTTLNETFPIHPEQLSAEDFSVSSVSVAALTLLVKRVFTDDVTLTFPQSLSFANCHFSQSVV